MALKAAAYCVLVQPPENDSALIVVQNEASPIMRGVVLHVGARVDEELRPGDVVYYTTRHIVEEKHVVPMQSLVAIEDAE